jgi:hypothetical protein
MVSKVLPNGLLSGLARTDSIRLCISNETKQKFVLKNED